ncbi:MAG: hypothetical protein JO235_09280 [Chroococcidiopsidaceae cyanobacterium CP_BM_RX_35]|nr:hypothetical protein [Chroococcidiopsidaceae cyanobacterium CP_BM_RX_35]
MVLSQLLSPSLAATPSLSDGIICIARGKKAGNNVYFYTSLIDNATLSKKQPVSVTMLEKQVTAGEEDLVILDKKKRTVSVTALDVETVSAPEQEPAALARTTLTGNNTFSGTDQTGTPVTFSLEKNYSAIKLTHAGQTYSGVCH